MTTYTADLGKSVSTDSNYYASSLSQPVLDANTQGCTSIMPSHVSDSPMPSLPDAHHTLPAPQLTSDSEFTFPTPKLQSKERNANATHASLWRSTRPSNPPDRLDAFILYNATKLIRRASSRSH